MESADQDEISAEAESHLSAVCANVMRDVAIQHPIVFFDLNVSELVQKRTLTTLRVDRLRDMCIDLGWIFLTFHLRRGKSHTSHDSHN